MKLNKISMGIAALCSLAAGSALAIPASSYTNVSEFDAAGTGTTQNIRVSGATASDPGLIISTLLSMADASPGVSSMTLYKIDNQVVMFGNADQAKLATRAGTSQLAVYKHSPGGSGNGVFPINNGALTRPFLSLPLINSACAGTSATVDPDGAGTLPSYTEVTCSSSATLTAAALAYVGTSDLEPAFFANAAGIANISSEPIASLIFGVPVTRNVYEALQTAQGKIVGNLTEAEMPTLTQGQITAMYTQLGITWSDLGITVPGLSAPNVHVVRRSTSSGTQKTYEAIIARTLNPISGARSCHAGQRAFVAPGTTLANNAAADTACNGATAALNVNGSGTDQVLRCMEGHNANTRGAIGMTSTDFTPTAGGAWRFVKIDGVAPTIANVKSGAYTQYADISLNTRTGGVNLTAAALGYPAYVTKLRDSFKDPAIVAALNASTPLFGATGFLALDSLTLPIPAPEFTGTTARNPWSRLIGTNINNCATANLAVF